MQKHYTVVAIQQKEITGFYRQKLRLAFLFIMALMLALAASAQNNREHKIFGEDGFQEMIRSAKPKFGIKAGYNMAKLTGSKLDFKPTTKNGFMVSGFYAMPSKSGLGFRSEMVFSRQGFGFDESGKTNSVISDYLYLPQFTTFGITKYVELQLGGQIGYLLKSSVSGKAGSETADITSSYNRLDYGGAAGIEVYPLKGLIVGGRYNLSFGNTYKTAKEGSIIPSPLPFTLSDVKAKNAVVNLFVGYRF